MHRNLRRALAAAVTAVAMMSPTPASAEAPYILEGLVAAREGGAGYTQSVPAISAWRGRGPAVVNVFYETFRSEDLLPNVQMLRQLPTTLLEIWNRDHAIPMISYGPPTPNRRTAEGLNDEFVRPFVRIVSAFVAGEDARLGTADDRRVYLRFGWEMNHPGYPWSPCHPHPAASGRSGASGNAGNAADFRAAWRYVHGLFVNAGLGNPSRVAWVYSVAAGTSCAEGRGPAGPEDTFPGQDVASWTGIDVYDDCPNAFTALEPHESAPGRLWANMLPRLRAMAPDLPVGINEAGTSSVLGTGDYSAAEKNLWIERYFDALRADDIRMSIWFNSNKGSGRFTGLCKDAPWEKPWAIFGAEYGDGERYGDETYVACVDTVTCGPADDPGCVAPACAPPTTYYAFSAYRAETTAPGLVGSDPANPRVVTNRQFEGLD